MNSVIWLEEASQTVRLDRGSSEEGSMKGNIDTPTVEMMPKIDRLLKQQGRRPARLAGDCRQTNSAAPSKPSTGAISSHG